MSRSAALREALKGGFFPFAESKGFVRTKSAHPSFTTFVRDRQGQADIFDIQWDKYHRPSFVVNFSQAPTQSLKVNNQQLSPFDYNTVGRLQRKRGPFGWFKLTKPLAEALRTMSLTYTPHEVVAQLIAVFPELEDWWASKAQGPHVYIV